MHIDKIVPHEVLEIVVYGLMEKLRYFTPMPTSYQIRWMTSLHIYIYKRDPDIMVVTEVIPRLSATRYHEFVCM